MGLFSYKIYIEISAWKETMKKSPGTFPRLNPPSQLWLRKKMIKTSSKIRCDLMRSTWTPAQPYLKTEWFSEHCNSGHLFFSPMVHCVHLFHQPTWCIIKDEVQRKKRFCFLRTRTNTTVRKTGFMDVWSSNFILRGESSKIWTSVNASWATH